MRTTEISWSVDQIEWERKRVGFISDCVYQPIVRSWIRCTARVGRGPEAAQLTVHNIFPVDAEQAEVMKGNQCEYEFHRGLSTIHHARVHNKATGKVRGGS